LSISASVLRDGCIYIKGCLIVNTLLETDLIRRVVACMCLYVISTCDSELKEMQCSK